MAISKVRTQIYLDHRQHEALKRAAKRRAVSMAQIVREAIAKYLFDETPADLDPRRGEEVYRADPAWDLLKYAEDIGGSGETNGASNLEEELYGPIEV